MHPINPRLELQPDFREGRSSRDCWAVQILGWERRRFGRLGSGTGRKWSSLKVVCVATIKSKKLKRLSLRPPSSVICSVLRGRPAGAWMEGNMAEDEKMESLWATLNANFNICVVLLCGHRQIKILCWTTEHQSCWRVTFPCKNCSSSRIRILTDRIYHIKDLDDYLVS